MVSKRASPARDDGFQCSLNETIGTAIEFSSVQFDSAARLDLDGATGAVPSK